MLLSNSSKNETKTLLRKLLQKENLEDFDFKLHEHNIKGDGFMGDIVFVELISSSKTYNLVLKCSKVSKVLREKSPVQQAFYNEIHFYEKIYPTLSSFQERKKSEKVFKSVPKCYGTYLDDNMEIIALENLKLKNYVLWDKTKPLKRRQIEIVIENYGIYHATSVALQDQEPEQFQKLVEPLHNMFHLFLQTSEMLGAFQDMIQSISEIFKDDFDAKTIQYWLTLKAKVYETYSNSRNIKRLNVITHGDCWNNNFMHRFQNDEPDDVVLLDFQLCYFTSPIYDLSYFLFSCLSEEDMKDMDNILKLYHKSFIKHLGELGSDSSLYPWKQFMDEWKNYAKFGIILCTLIHNLSLAENEEVPDMAKAAENGEDVIRVFGGAIKNKAAYRNRLKYIVQYVTSNNLI